MAGVAVGLALLLLALTAHAAAGERANRIAWQDTAYAYALAEVADPPAQSADAALFLAVSDYYDGTPMTRAYVAALGADPPVPPGLDRLPGPGEVAASPAMRRLLGSTPDDQLDDRFPGRVTLTIGAAGLAHDNDLVAIVGRTPDQLRDVRSVQVVFLETAATMVITSALGAGLGLVLACVVAGQRGVPWHWPDATVLAYLGGGALAALLFATLALPLLDSATRHDAVRYE